VKIYFLFLCFVFPLAAADVSTPDAVWNLHGQATLTPQAHPGFASLYNNPLISFDSQADAKTSFTATVFAGVRPWKNTEIYLNPEFAAGAGLSNSHGIAGFPNAEIYRVGDSASLRGFISRLYWRQTIPLGGPKERIEDAANTLATTTDVSRLTITFGKFSLNDFFDGNRYAHDPRTQFLNWSLMDNGAWDYAADTRGYTYGIHLDLNQERWALRFASVMIPFSANQLDLDADVARARGDNLEFEYRYSFRERPGKVRALAFLNSARMGNYVRATADPALDLLASRSYSHKYGFGLGIEQELTASLGLFARLGWNDGATETWAFTEVDQTASIGLSLRGSGWKRENDVLGFAYIANGISGDHAAFLRAGGHGFMVGDGGLHYGAEQILELYYALSLEPAHISFDFQQVFNPGYNQDRGPVSVVALRLHAEI
jgi:high affinity Mn2+ porin